MSYSNLIQWPINPNEGDVYQSPNGDIWFFDGCAWVATCCFISCDPLTDGIGLKLVTDGGDSATLPLEPLQYGSITTWVFYQSGQIVLYTFKTINGWELLVPDNTFATINQNTQFPISNAWTDISIPEISSIETFCGSTGELYCASAESIEYNGLSTYFRFDGVDAFGSFNGPIIGWDSESSNWALFNVGGSGILASISGDPNTWPIGIWTPIDPSISSFETLSGPCECDPYTNGLTLIATGNYPEVGLGSVYAYFEWGGTSFSVIPFNNVLIEEISGTFFLTVGGTAEASAPSLLGPWDTSIGSFYDSIESVCGPLPSTQMCIGIDDGMTINTYSMVRFELDSGLIAFGNFDVDIQVVFDDINNEWNIISSSSLIGTVSGSSMGPWNGGEPINTVPPYTIIIQEGYC